ncbi:MAG: hypothetical protein D6737_16090 [Chloroflexi bacterium]|nr:MAG: hypothetical protein D6737_16090 [Chloroflexota bacterium]
MAQRTGTLLDTIQDDPKGPFPFIIPEVMMPIFPLIALMGWMIVGVMVLIGIFFLSPAFEDYFSAPKAVREGAPSAAQVAQEYQAATGVEVNTDIQFYVDAQHEAHIIETWVPQVKFLGLGFGLMAIAMGLGTIAKRLRRMGKLVNAHMNPQFAPPIPEQPLRRRFQQLSVMMGIMMLMAAVVVGLIIAFGATSDYWSNPQAVLNAALPGSELMDNFSTIQGYKMWNGPFRMLSMSFLFIGITIGLTVIIYVLRIQSEILVQFYARSTGRR